MANNNNLNTLRGVCLIILVIVFIVSGLQVFNVATLSDTFIRIIGILCLLAVFGLSYAFFRNKFKK